MLVITALYGVSLNFNLTLWVLLDDYIKTCITLRLKLYKSELCSDKFSEGKIPYYQNTTF